MKGSSRVGQMKKAVEILVNVLPMEAYVIQEKSKKKNKYKRKKEK